MIIAIFQHFFFSRWQVISVWMENNLFSFFCEIIVTLANGNTHKHESNDFFRCAIVAWHERDKHEYSGAEKFISGRKKSNHQRFNSCEKKFYWLLLFFFASFEPTTANWHGDLHAFFNPSKQHTAKKQCFSVFLPLVSIFPFFSSSPKSFSHSAFVFSEPAFCLFELIRKIGVSLKLFFNIYSCQLNNNHQQE